MKNCNVKFKIIFFLFLLFGIFGLAQNSRAATYYVATNGNNSNPGTESQPWLTIQKAANTMVAGDTVYIKAGTYTERVTLENSGSAGNYITYQNYPGNTVIVQAQSSESCSASGSYTCTFCFPDNRALSYIKIKGLTIRNASLANIDIRGTSTTKSYIILDGITSTDAYLCIYLHGGVSNSQIINSTLTDCQNGIYGDLANSNILINNNEVSYNVVKCPSLDSYYAHGIHFNNWTQTPDTNIKISNNNVHHNKIQGILVMSEDQFYITGNHSHHNGATGIQIEGMNTTGKSSNIIVENNTCEYNGATNDWETGIWIDDTDNAVVQNNIVRYNKNGMYITGSTNTIVRRNILYENSKYFGLMLNESPQYGANNNVILAHNIFHKNSGTGAAIQIGYYSDTSPPTNVVLKNNILSDTLNPIELAVRGLTHKLDYNNYYNSVRVLNFNWQGVNKIWDQYLAISSQSSHSITSNPQFVDPINLDFRLQANSPCVNTGDFLTKTSSSGSGTSIVVTDARYFSNGYGIVAGDSIIVGSNGPVRVTNVNYNTNTITVDKSISWDKGDGVSYPYSGSAPDIGAYEYVGTQTSDTTPPAAPTGLSVQ